MGPRESQWGNAAFVRRTRGPARRTHGPARLVAALAALLIAHCADARKTYGTANPRDTDISALVSIADGQPFTVIRGDDLRRGTKGVTLVAGDIVETAPDAFLVVELQGGSPEDPWASLIGIGPSSGIYFLPRVGAATLVVLKGWLKADIRAEAKPGAITIVGSRLGLQSQHAIVLLHADEHSDALFDEQGSGTLLLRDTAATHSDQQTQPNQFFVRQDRSEVLVQPRPSADFLARMPVAFRDTLPKKASPTPESPLEPQQVRKVTYSDIQSWLTLPRDWRAGFVTRFRRRLGDPAFFAAMDAHLALYPEWVPLLHPKQSSEPR